MYTSLKTVKRLLPALAVCLVVAMSNLWAEDQPPKPHMLYFYNPSCRLCTRTNEVVAEVEEKYADQMGHQRFNIADPAHGTDNVLYMFELMDEMEVPEEGNVTLVVFIGQISVENGEAIFQPERVLVEGEDIIEKLDATAAEYLSSQGKGGSLGMVRPAPFFLPQLG